jgi:signal transduction histidine kinase
LDPVTVILRLYKLFRPANENIRNVMSTEFQSDIEALSGGTVASILDVVCRVTGMGFAAVARVTPERWVCIAVSDQISFGLTLGGELEVETTICHEVRQAREVVAIDHVAEDEIYCQHHTPAKYGLQSYISMPIFLSDGSFYGTLCAIDPKPAKVKNAGVIGMFELFAKMIASQLEASQRLAESGRKLANVEAALLDANTTAKLREQFIAVIGHDLRNPLASIAAGIYFLQKATPDRKLRDVVQTMQKSVARMASLTENLLDFARGRLGGGITLNRSPEALEPALRQVIDEIKSAYPERTIDVDINMTKPVNADRGRISQLLSNLLSNAVVYGTAGEPVRVRATTDAMFELEVINTGPPISAATMKQLFLPFARGQVKPSQQGLGLGLFIASEIANAHGGRIDVTSNADVTAFTFHMPLG